MKSSLDIFLEQASTTKSPFIIRYPKGNIPSEISLSASDKTLIEHKKEV
jgi:deoxyxylulose-5-phosphate synthase